MKQSYELILDLKLPEKLDTAVEQPVQQTILTVKDLEKELLVLRLAFGKLKAAAYQAVAPLAAVFADGISQAVFAATRWVRTLGQVIRGLFGITGAGKVVEKTIRKAGKTAQRSLASFDQLNRLQKSPASGGTVTTTKEVPADSRISEEAQRIVERIKAILAPLMALDTSPILWSFYRMQEQLELFLETTGQVLGKLWNDHLAPFLVWLGDHLLPVVNYFFNRILQFLTQVVGQAGEGFLQMLTDIKPLTDFLKYVLLTLIDQVGRLFLRMRNSMEEDGSALKELFVTLGAAVRQVWDTIAPVVRQIHGIFIECFRSIGDTVFSVIQSVIRVLTGAVQVIAGVLTGDWEQVWKGMGTICKNAVNAIIGVLNVLITALIGALNSAIKLFNKLKIKIPDWVPGMGGKEFGFKIKTVTAPQIPYLAKGAVLPANQPFLAMVGDQRHGTNIEAPLATIQEAVAQVMGDQVEAMMAGFEALLAENRQLRHTVEGIEIGDTVIGQAAGRYNRRQAIIRGGMV